MLSKRRFLGVLFLCSSTLFVAGQVNLVPNGNFENYTQLPNNIGQWSRCTNWTNVNGISAIGTSPDYFHTSGTGHASLPNSLFANISPHSGNAMMGMITWGNVTIRNYHEYIAVKLTTPLEKGKFYEVSFWMTNGDSDWHYSHAAKHFGVTLSEDKLVQNGTGPIYANPQYEIPGEFWSSEWQQFKYVVYADSSYEQLTFGIFNHNNEALWTSPYSSGSMGNYVFIDAVELYELEEKELQMPDAFSPNGDGVNERFSPIGLRIDELVFFRIYNRWGQEVYNGTDLKGWDGNFNGVAQASDVYIYVLEYQQAINLETRKIKGRLTLLR